MAASTLIVPAMRVQSWVYSMEKQIIIDSQWEGLSNRVEPSVSIPNGGKGKIPDSVIHYVTDKFTPGVQFTTVPSLDKLILQGQGGLQPVDGNEEKPKVRYKSVYYNVQRKGLTIKDESVEGDLTEAYSILEERVSLLSDYFTELNDYNKARAILEGADEYLTESKYWTGDTISSAPVAVTTHPYALWRGATAPATWSATDNTYRLTNLIGTAATVGLNDAFEAATVTFTKTALDKMILRASQTIRKLNWKADGKPVHWIIILSETQADQLLADTAGGNWSTLFKDAGSRGVDNRAISGVIGVYRGAAVCVNPRQPLINCTVAGATYASSFQYIKPWGDSRVPTVKASDTGTCEIGMCLGKGSVGSAMIKKLDFNKMGKDYNFSTGFEARKSCGDVRMDFQDAASIVNQPKNWSSFLYFTPTPAVAL